MYWRRHCYDKVRRCPGWAGPGWKRTYYDEKPDHWDSVHNDDGNFPFETSALRRIEWYQRRNRCDNGFLWTMDLIDPWRMFRVHRCSKCDVRTIPMFTRWLDPSWWKWVLTHDIWWSLKDLKYHKGRWVEPAPWWSLPDAIWRAFGWPRWKSWYRNKVFSAGLWWKDFWTWANPELRRQDRERVMKYHFWSKAELR